MALSVAASAAGPVKISQAVLRDKVRGGWAGQVIGCTFGGPTEFRFRNQTSTDDHLIHIVGYAQAAVPPKVMQFPLGASQSRPRCCILCRQ